MPFAFAVLLQARVPHSAEAQTPSPGPADSITAAALERHYRMLTADSMRGDPASGLTAYGSSAALARTAQYVAAKFQAAGLQPAGDQGNWLQHYPIPGSRRADPEKSKLYILAQPKQGTKPVLTEQGNAVTHLMTLPFTADAFYAVDTVLHPDAPGAQGGGQGSVVGFDLFGPPPVLVAGEQTPATIRQAALHDKVVFYLPAPGSDSAAQNEIATLLGTSNHVVIVQDEDSSTFARRGAAASWPVFLDRYLSAAWRPRRWAIVVRAAALREVLVQAGVDLAELRGVNTPRVRELSAIVYLAPAGAAVSEGAARESAPAPTLPNVVGLLRGQSEERVVVVTAPLGPGARTAGAVAGLLELVRAFARADIHPACSILFGAVSGPPPEVWGSQFLADRWQDRLSVPFVADVTLDGFAPSARSSSDGSSIDSVWIAGLSDVDLPVRAEWLAARHSELRLRVLDGGTALAPSSAHIAFAQRGVPSLSVRMEETGASDAAGSAGIEARVDTATAFDLEAAARVLRLVYYLTDELARSPRTPEWTAAARARRQQLEAELGDTVGP